jgi:hypothetical protein
VTSTEKQVIARWESKSRKWWAELTVDAWGYSYRGVDCGGSLGDLTGLQAIEQMQSRVDNGYFQPDANTSPMLRVI